MVIYLARVASDPMGAQDPFGNVRLVAGDGLALPPIHQVEGGGLQVERYKVNSLVWHVTPSGHSNLTVITFQLSVGIIARWQADRVDAFIELDGMFEFQNGNVTGHGGWIEIQRNEGPGDVNPLL